MSYTPVGRTLSRGAGIGIRLLQVFSEKLSGGAIGLDPTFLREETVDLIGEDEFLEFDTLFAQSLNERDGLVERHIAIVIAVNEQDR